MSDDQDDWNEYGPMSYSLQDICQPFTKQTPFFLAYGKVPTMFMEEDFSAGEQPPEGPGNSSDGDEHAALDAHVEAAMNLFKHRQEPQVTDEAAQQSQGDLCACYPHGLL